MREDKKKALALPAVRGNLYSATAAAGVSFWGVVVRIIASWLNFLVADGGGGFWLDAGFD